jgi:hypothetical protein
MNRLALAALLLFVGCGDLSSVKSSARKSDSSRAPQSEADSSVALAEFNTAGEEGKLASKTAEPKKAESTRKIIYTANVDLAVEEFAGIPAQVKKLVKQYGGYIAGNSLSAESGSNRSGRWTLRIPADDFEAFMEGAKSLGEIMQYQVDSREVTAEYFDIQAWIKNKQIERDRLQTLLKENERVAKLKDVLEIERELSRVQGEIERFQGRLRQFDNLVSLTTVHLNIQQIHNYVPPEAAGFFTLARRSFDESWLALQSTGQAIALAAISFAPWLPFIIVGVLLLRFGWRKVRPSKRNPVS